jgi:tetratricopeptide (TPR) repeat protein
MSSDATPAPPPADGETLPPPRKPDAEGASAVLPARLGAYRVDGPLGKGGMGEVLRGFDERLHRAVALKRIGAGPREHPEARARFWREARALAALDHPGIVRIHEIGEAADGALFLAMEFVEGESLQAVLAGGIAWPLDRALAVVTQAADALGAAHAAGLVHRDVKPANLLLTPNGAVKVVDFGLARRVGPAGAPDRVTETGAVLGTPAYMAPEQLAGQNEVIGPRADVFALGILLYRLLGGTHPFTRDTPQATALALAGGLYAPLESLRSDLPPACAAVVARCLAVRPEDRPADGRALASLLRTLPGAPPANPAEPEAAHLAGLAFATASPPGAAQAPPSLPAATPGTPLTPGAAAPVVNDASAAPRAWPVPRSTAALLAVLGLVAAAFVLTRPATPPAVSATAAPTSTAPPAGAGATPATATRPARPVVAVLGFRAPDDDPDDPRAAVLADALRLALDVHPESLVSVPAAALEGALPPDVPVDATLDPRRLARPHAGPGHIDFVVTGRLDGADGELMRVEVALVETTTGDARRTFTVSGGTEVVPLAWQLAAVLAEVIELRLPAGVEPPTRSTSAWGALLGARRALRAGDFETHESRLAWALQLDPRFTLARLDRLALLRARRDATALAAEAAALQRDLEGGREVEHLQLAAQAFAAFGRGDTVEALRRLHRVLDRFPWDVDTAHLLLALRFHDPELRDFDEVERLARALLEIAPRSEEAASRLVRVLSWRGRVADADAALAALGVKPDDPAFLEVFAEQDLYAGRFDAAIARLDTALVRSPGDLYALHMGIAARVLGGDCPAAARRAFDRIAGIEATGKPANLDWTYSLAVQALVCAGEWKQARRTMETWAATGESGREQVALLRPRLARVAGDAPTALRLIRTGLARRETPPEVRAGFMTQLAALGRDAAEIGALATEARASALEPGLSPPRRAAWQRASDHLTVAALAARGRIAEAAAAAAGLVAPWHAVRGEGDLGATVEAMSLHADLLADAGQTAAARAARERIVALGYARLWVHDLWFRARQALDATRPAK